MDFIININGLFVINQSFSTPFESCNITKKNQLKLIITCPDYGFKKAITLI